MTSTKEHQRCRAFAVNSGERCKRTRMVGSKYCWHHQTWGTTVASLLLGLVSGFLINVASNRYTERAPKLDAYLNWERLADDTVFVYPTNVTPYEFTFWIQNTGDIAADEMFVRLVTHSYSTNFVDGPKWFYEDVGAFANVDPMLAAMVQRGDKSIPPAFGARFQPFSLDPTKVRIFFGFLTYGATGAETKRGRIHIAFENPSGKTNVLRSEAARHYLHRLNPEIAERIDLATMKLTFDSTNEFRAFQRGSPSARVE